MKDSQYYGLMSCIFLAASLAAHGWPVLALSMLFLLSKWAEYLSNRKEKLMQKLDLAKFGEE